MIQLGKFETLRDTLGRHLRLRVRQGAPNGPHPAPPRRPAQGPAAAALFRVIQLALFPAGTAGYLWALPKLLVYSRRTGVSATLLASLHTRFMQHRLGTRDDEPAERLMMVMPNVSRTGFSLVAAPTIAAHGATGYVPRVYRYPYEGEAPLRHQDSARTSFFDAALQRHLPGVGQLVILGAGFDTRAFRFSGADHVRCFEVDKPLTQAFKLGMLKRAGLSTQLASYVAADLRTQDWWSKLLAAGFDPDRPAFFLWEPVTMYLDRASVEATLRRIGGGAAGSVVSFDYFAPLPASPSTSESTTLPRHGIVPWSSSGPSAWPWRNTEISAKRPDGGARRPASSPPSSAEQGNPAGKELFTFRRPSCRPDITIRKRRRNKAGASWRGLPKGVSL